MGGAGGSSSFGWEDISFIIKEKTHYAFLKALTYGRGGGFIDKSRSAHEKDVS
jgi:hypothetical protein